MLISIFCSACDYENEPKLTEPEIVQEEVENNTKNHLQGRSITDFFSLTRCSQDCAGPDGKCCTSDDSDDCKKSCEQEYIPMASLSRRGRICEDDGSCFPNPLKMEEFILKVFTVKPEELIGAIFTKDQKVVASLETGDLMFDQKDRAAYLLFGLENPDLLGEELFLRVKTVQENPFQFSNHQTITMDYYLGKGRFEY